MAHRASITILFLFVLMVSSASTQAQSYRFSPYPDLWYNDVDGVRLGLRVLGEVEGTFNDGPHRLDAGLWIGSKLPDNPVSHYISFTESIAAISDFGSEGSIQLISSSRTGYVLHQFRLNKRWQKGFDELDYFEALVYGSFEKNFESDYRFTPSLWSSKWKTIVGTKTEFSKASEIIRSQVNLDLLRELNEGFNVIEFQFKNTFKPSEKVSFKTRVFLSKVDDNAYGEYLGNIWTSGQHRWLDSGFTRANMSFQTDGINDGLLHHNGGPNLRGYVGRFDHYERVYGINLQFNFNNLIQNRIKSNTYIGDLINFDSYLFFDLGGGDNEIVYSNPPTLFPDLVLSDTGVLMNAGLGFQLSANIPDYLGKDRGIFIRYDIPFWLSSPENNESNFKYRNILGIGAIFNF